MLIEYQVTKRKEQDKESNYFNEVCECLENIKGIKRIGNHNDFKNSGTYRLRKLNEESEIQDTMVEVSYDDSIKETIISLARENCNFEQTKKSMDMLTAKIIEELNQRGLGII
jgi:uncharacterized protein YkvS